MKIGYMLIGIGDIEPCPVHAVLVRKASFEFLHVLMQLLVFLSYLESCIFDILALLYEGIYRCLKLGWVVCVFQVRKLSGGRLASFKIPR